MGKKLSLRKDCFFVGVMLDVRCGWEAFLSPICALMAAYPVLLSVFIDAPGLSIILEHPFSSLCNGEL